MRRLWLGLAVLLCGCSPVYVLKSWSGHGRLVSKQRPIREILADPAAPEDLKLRLKLVEDARAFAAETMGFKPSDSYTTYVETPRPYVTLAVSACRKTAFEAYEWWFPFVGKVPYKGFFDDSDALREAARLERKGYDTDTARVQAYSTLGWFSDPVLSTMLAEAPWNVAETLIHEMAHAELYFKGRTDFDESAATFIGRQGAADFIRSRFGEGSPEWEGMEREAAGREAFVEDMERLYGELSAVYSSASPEEEKLRRKEEVFAAFRSRREALGAKVPKGLNNATVLAYRRYHLDLGDFARAYSWAGGDWRRFMDLLRSLEKNRPGESLRERLERAPVRNPGP